MPSSSHAPLRPRKYLFMVELIVRRRSLPFGAESRTARAPSQATLGSMPACAFRIHTPPTEAILDDLSCTILFWRCSATRSTTISGGSARSEKTCDHRDADG